MFKNYIADEWVEGATTIDNINPSDVSDVIGSFAQADRAQAEQALEAARRAQPKWSAKGLEERHKVLVGIGDELIARSEELGELLSREEGKPLREGIGEIHPAG